MELLFSCLTLFLISIGAGMLLGKLIDRKSVANVKDANKDNPKKDSVFLKKYKEVDIDRWKTTTKLAGFSLALGFLLLSTEVYKKRTNLEVEAKIVTPIDVLKDWIDPDLEILEPPPPRELPPPNPPPPPPPIPEKIIVVENKVEKIPEIIAPEPVKRPPLPMPPVVRPPIKTKLPPPTISPPPVREAEEERKKILFEFVEVMPEFEKGNDNLRRQVRKNYRTPNSFVGKGKVNTRFVVLEDGSIGDIQILKGIDGCDACSEQAIKAIRKVKGKFKPGKQAGKPVQVWFTLPISIEVR